MTRDDFAACARISDARMVSATLERDHPALGALMRRTLSLVSGALCGLLALSGCDPFGFEEIPLACDILADTGCADGQTCINVDEPTCVTAGAGLHGVGCVKDEDCARLHLCVKGTNGSRTCQRRCDLRKPDSCAEAGKADGNEALASAACLWVTANGARNLGYCTAPQCSPASNEGCTDEQKCVGGIEPRCEPANKEVTVTIDGKEVTYKYGQVALGGDCSGPGNCVLGGVCAGVEADDGSAQQRCLKSCKVAVDGVPAKASEGCQEDYACKALTFVPQGRSSPRSMPAGQGFCGLKHCNAVTNAGCKSVNKCVGSSTPYCAAPGDTKLLEQCFKLSDCDASTTCVAGPTKALCVQKCDTSGTVAGKGCPQDQKCYTLLDEEQKPRPNHLGYCGPKS